MIIRPWHTGVAFLLLTLGSGCATAPVAAPGEPKVAAIGTGTARVVFVRADERYVIVQGANLPKGGHEATVFRDETPVGTVRFTELRQGSSAAADIVEGVLQPGDKILR